MKSKSLKLLSLFLALMTIVSTVAACNTTAPTPDATQPSTQPTTSVTDQVTLPSTDPITDLVTDPMTFPSTDATISATESNNESKDVTSAVNTEPMDSTESITLPSTESITLPSTESITLPSTETITMPSTETITMPSTETITLPSTEINTLPTIETVTTPYTEIITLPSFETVTTPSTDLQTDLIITESSTNNIITDTESFTETEAVTETETEMETETETDIIIETESTTLPSTEIITLPSIETVTDTFTETIFDTVTEEDTYTETISELEPESATESDSALPSETVTDSDTVAPTESETSAGVVPGTESNASSETATEGTTETTAPDVEIDESILTVFANGAYNAAFIRGDLANQLDKNIYNEIRTLFKTKTTVNPALKTDFVGVGKEPYTGPAILIGETSYQESKDIYATLKDNQAVAKLVGNKYVIAFASADAAAKLVTTLEGYLKKKATATEVKIDDTWNASVKVTTSYSENANFKDSGLVKEITVNNLGLGTAYNAGQGCKTYIKSDVTSKSGFTSICSAIEKAGATRYTSNTIGVNYFSTYVTQTQIIHVMYFPNKKQVRTAVDVRGTGTNGFTLPGLSLENKYTKTTESAMIVCDISNSDWPGGMCIIFKLANGHFFIVDAGIGGKISDGRTYYGSSSGWIYATLAKHAEDPKNIIVDSWLITHVHSDHAGGLYDMALGYHGKKGSAKHTVMPKNVKNYIKINQIIYNSPDNLPDCNREHWMGEIIKGFNVQNVVKAHPGQVFFFADLTITVFGAQDIMLEDSSKCGDTNEFSISVRAEFNGRSLLLLGDSDGIPNKQLAIIYKEALKSDYLQMAHHGYGDTGDHDVNSYCNPDYAIWVVADDDLRSNYKINMNTSVTTLKVKTHYKPGTGNLVFNSKWGTSTMSRSEMIAAIPKCDGTYCGNSNCSVNTSFKDAYA